MTRKSAIVNDSHQYRPLVAPIFPRDSVRRNVTGLRPVAWLCSGGHRHTTRPEAEVCNR